MNNLISRVHRFIVSEDGPTAVEYAVMMGLIVIAIVDGGQQPRQEHQRHVQHGQQHARFVVIVPNAAPKTSSSRKGPRQ